MSISIIKVVCIAFLHFNLFKLNESYIKNVASKRDVSSPSMDLKVAPAGAHLVFTPGGKVIGNTQVIQVLWGTGNYHPQVSSTSTPSLATFYQQTLSNGALTSWLNSEYKTPQQNINPGSYVGLYTITPSAANNGATISDAQIQAELKAQIAAGGLPAPTLDAQGYPQTYYAVYFPPAKSITMGGSSSCVARGFCAYHGTVAAAGSRNEFYYGVHPDMQTGGCTSGCGSGTVFEQYTQVSSHEMIEAMTDPEVGLNIVTWYDNTYGEISDICSTIATYSACDGVTYSIQTHFSNARNDCVDIGTPTCGPAPPTVKPTYAPTVTPGSIPNLATWTRTGSTSIATTGCMNAGTSCGQAGATTPTNGDSSFSTTFIPSAGQTQLSFWFKMICPDTVTYDWATATLVDNTLGTTSTVVGKTCVNTGVWTQQTVTVTPGHSYTITLVSHDDNYSTDPTYTLFDSITMISSNTVSSVVPSYTPSRAPISPSVTPSVVPSRQPIVPTTVAPSYLPSVLPTIAPGDISNLATWTRTGSTSIATTGCINAGTSCGQAGATTPTNGDSSFSTTFTPSAGQTQLLFSYKMICPDTVTYDWVTATLVDNTLGTTSTVVGKTCVNTGVWTQQSVALTPGHSYTITLVSHDDNYSTDPSYTMFDGVSLPTAISVSPSRQPAISPSVVPTYAPSRSPTVGPTFSPTNGAISNPGFENGLSSWSIAGTASVVTSGCYGGTGSCARLGSTTQTNGDSSLTQSFVTSTQTQLSFWYKMTCPDTVDYDWATAILLDNTANTKSIIMAKVCVTSVAWTQVVASVIPGHSYTLILSSRDDNYAADPTFTLFDNILLVTVASGLSSPSSAPTVTIAGGLNLGSADASMSSNSQLIGGVVGGVLGVFLIALLLASFFIYRRWNANRLAGEKDMNFHDVYGNSNYYLSEPNTMTNPYNDTRSSISSSSAHGGNTISLSSNHV